MSDRSLCEFCKSRLKTMGCAKCLGMMFLGSKFCGHCGATAQVAELLEETDPGDCPRCKVELQSLSIDSVHIRECVHCGGFWASVREFEELCSSSERQAAVLGFMGSYAHPISNPPAVSYVPCPECEQLMNRSNFARSSGVIIDMCRDHGVWFDAGELPKIIEFIEKGGLDRAREKERITIQDERSKLRDEQRRLELMARRSGTANFKDDDSGFGGLIARLFG